MDPSLYIVAMWNVDNSQRGKVQARVEVPWYMTHKRKRGRESWCACLTANLTAHLAGYPLSPCR